MEYKRITHTFEPIYDGNSRILILGSFPSVKSRANNFYYGHPQNRFWKVMKQLMNYSGELNTIEEKRIFLLRYHIAIWDVVYQCDIKGSSDSSIINVIPNELNRVLDNAPIEKIYVNGGKAYELYMKYCYQIIKREAIKLPSTSPANAAFSADRLVEVWRKLGIGS